LLAEMAWGTLDTDTGEWLLESEQPTLEPPDRSMISYTQYNKQKYPTDNVDEKTKAENLELQIKQKHNFTMQGEPGQEFRGVYSMLVKNMSVPIGVKKGYGITKVVENENEVPEEPETDEDAVKRNLVRFGRYRILPSFFFLLNSLNKEKPQRTNITVVLRSFSEALLQDVAREIQMFCNTEHPCYSGTMRTKKAILNGDKGSMDFQLTDAFKGRLVKDVGDDGQYEMYLNLPDRDSNPPPEFTPDPNNPDALPPDHTPEPTTYDGYSAISAGIAKEIAAETKMCYIEDQNPKDEDPTHVLFLDKGDTAVHQIYVSPGTQPLAVDLRDAKDNSELNAEDFPDVFLRVDPYRAITEVDYFLKEIAGLEKQRTEEIKKAKEAPVAKAAELTREELKALPPKDYLYKTVIPALLPALQVITRDRPPDPVTWLALYLLRHPKEYNKVLAAE